MPRLAAAVALIALVLSGPALSQTKTAKTGGYDQLNLFGEAFGRIRQDAVEPTGEEKLIGAAIAGMLSGLDPYSAYLDPEAYQALQHPSGDKAVGIGLAATIDNGQLKVISPRDGSPAAAAGVKPGDLIYAIDKEPTYDLTLDEVERKLRGPEGSTVRLTLRRGNGGPIKLEIKRAAAAAPGVSGRLEGPNIGYLRIAGFDAGSAAALAATVQDLRRQGGNKLIGYILDLRNDPGGDFAAAVKTADAFLDKGDIAIVKGRKPDSLKHIAATPGDLADGLPIVALVNGGTAREAELVAGALQDNRRAVLLGAKTFGESAIESILPLGNGAAIRLTTGRFVTPTGKEIQGKGIEPDLTVTPLKVEKLAQSERRREADLPGALKNPDVTTSTRGKSPPAPDRAAAPPSAKPGVLPAADVGSDGDEQLNAARDILHGLAQVSGRATQ